METITITIEKIKAIAPGATVSEWRRGKIVRHYVNLNGLRATKLWLDEADEKLHVRVGRGRDSSDAISAVEALIGCNLTSRHRDGAVAPYVVVEG